ncbi:hypothetical protein FA13DRAFT_1817884 [Coprinellus micaceus]|uniref:Uncharacterized protein n=1 Tax=Coprinellus micaceus TaxID=71717 RepID=A0A4Y7SS91_COPMI|nr:hypothetical protein FA13DRAFT_1817884 [Coprinellus micaceus]
MDDSPFADRLETNYCPSDSEVGEIRKLLEAPHPELPALDAEIARVSEQLKALQSKRNGYERYMTTHRSLLSPIRRLPIEILHNIFVHCLPTDHNSLMSPVEAPMLLTHICKQWRELVQGMPLLWSSIYIPIPNYPTVASCVATMGYTRPTRDGAQLSEEQQEVVDEVFATWDAKIEQRRDVVRQWLERAEGSNLFISLMQWDARREPGPSHPAPGVNTDSAERGAVQEIVELIRSYSKQWKRLEISASRSIVRQLLSVPAEEAPNIEFLRVSSRPVFVLPNPAMFGPMGVNLAGLPAQEDSNDSLFPDGSLVTAPSIKGLSLRVVQQDITRVPTRWDTLTGLFFYGYAQHGPPTSVPLTFTPSQALDLLAMCPNLKSCGLAVGSHSSWTLAGPPGATVPADIIDEPRRVVLAHLERLFVQEQPSYPLAKFFESLEMPKLLSLSFATTIAPTKPIERGEADPDAPPAPTTHGGPFQQLIGHPMVHHASLFAPTHSPTAASPPPPESSLIVILRNCGHSIKKLEFDYHSQTQANLRECLRLAENVEKLGLNIVGNPAGGLNNRSGMYYINDRGREHAPAYMGNTFFRELIPAVDGKDEGELGCLCPNMTSFSVRLMTAEFNEEALMEFVRARRHAKVLKRGVARLRKVKVSFALEKKKRKPVGDATDGNDGGEAELEDVVIRSPLSMLGRKLKKKPAPWALLKSLEGQPDVDLEGLEAEVSWPRSEGRGLMMLPGRLMSEGMWSPSWAWRRKDCRVTF